MRIIPSLDGELFAHYGTGSIEKVPYNIEEMLKTSVNLDSTNKFTITGGTTTKIIGIDLTSGKVSDSFFLKCYEPRNSYKFRIF